jgi:hypothetical protein
VARVRRHGRHDDLPLYVVALDAATDPGWLDNRIPVPISSILTVWLGHGVTAALPIWTTAQQIAAVRHPPRIDAQGFLLWLPQTSERVFVSA